MRKILSLLSLIICSNLVWASNPCMPIFLACKQAGYYKGGNNIGKGLIDNCMLPIVNQQMQLADANFKAETIDQCKIQLREIMKHAVS